MTKAVTSAGDSIKITQTTNADTAIKAGVTLKELKSAPAIGGTPSQIDATSLDDTECKVYINGLADYGSLDFTFNAMPFGLMDSNVAILNKIDKSKSVDIEYIASNLGLKITFSGVYIDWEIGGAAVDSVRDLVMHMTMANGPTFAAKS